MKTEREYPYFTEGEKVICVKSATKLTTTPNNNGDNVDPPIGEIIEGETYEVVRPQCTPMGIMVKNASGKEIWANRHDYFQWID